MLLLSPIPEYQEISLLTEQLTSENFYLKGLTRWPLDMRLIPTFGSDFGPNHTTSHISTEMLASLFFPFIARNPEAHAGPSQIRQQPAGLNETHPAYFPFSRWICGFQAFSKLEWNSHWKPHRASCLEQSCRAPSTFHEAGSKILEAGSWPT